MQPPTTANVSFDILSTMFGQSNVSYALLQEKASNLTQFVNVLDQCQVGMARMPDY
jgi:hypothetical protein